MATTKIWPVNDKKKADNSSKKKLKAIINRVIDYCENEDKTTIKVYWSTFLVTLCSENIYL